MLYQFEVQVNEEWLSKYINSLLSEARSKDEKIENGALDRLFQLIALGYLPPRYEQRCSRVLRRKVPEDLAEKHFHYINEIMKYVDDSTKLVEFTRAKLLSSVTTNPNVTEMGNYA
ncbi:MAG: hypothetical protein IPP17_31440 [Bacteroidetes bacterium]|nr:hypothetical protein [Bacteroidota bacterium]